jgi:hypothetical protein
VPGPDSPGTSTAGPAARHWLFPRLPLAAGAGAITAICGMLDAATFLGLGHVFAETMNGNIVFPAFTAGARGIPGLTSALPSNLLPYVVALVCFAAGAIVGGRLVRRDGGTGRRVGFASDAGLNPHQRPSQALKQLEPAFVRPVRSGPLSVSQFPAVMTDAKGMFARPAVW